MAFTNEIGEDLDPGDETRRYGHYIHVDAAEDLYAGEAVTIDSNGEATRVSANGSDSVAGIAYINASSGEEVTIKTNGPVLAAVETDAAQGDTVGTHDGSAENVDAGDLSVNGDEYVVLRVGTKTNPRSDSDDDYALVAQRP
jgi:hypothetical protein